MHDAFFPPAFFTYSYKIHFLPRPPSPFLFPHLSKYCSDKNPNLPYHTRGGRGGGGYTLNAAARFMT